MIRAGFVGLLGALLSSQAAHAEIGVPTGPGGYYFSFESSYQNHEVANASRTPSSPPPGVTKTSVTCAQYSAGSISRGTLFGGGSASGCSPTFGSSFTSGVGTNAIAAASAIGPGQGALATSDEFLKARDGSFEGVSAGYVLPAPLFSLVTRVEGYANGGFATANATTRSFGARSVDNSIAIADASVGSEGVYGNAMQEVRTGEFGLRFKADRRIGALEIALSAEPFFILSREKSSDFGSEPVVFAAANASRTADVGARLYGAQVALEAAYPLFPRFSIVARGSIGGYAFDANGTFASSIPHFAANNQMEILTGVANGGGVRVGAQAGVRYVVTPGVWLSLLGGIDYLSAFPTAGIPLHQGDPAAHVAARESVDYRVGLRLTVATLGETSPGAP